MDRQGKAGERILKSLTSWAKKELVWRLLAKILFFLFLISVIKNAVNKYGLNLQEFLNKDL